jgi:putative DNA primase/helicase
LRQLNYMTLTAEQNRINQSSDFWRYQIGINVIPADTKNKVPSIRWSQWQDKPIPEEIHNTWKKSGDFSKGLAIIPGKIWHKEDKKGFYFIFIDADKREGIDELCTRNGRTISLENMSEKFLVEQHKDNLDKAHIFFYSPIPFVQKAADSIIGLEVKGVGHDGISFCSPSIHKSGHPYEIIGTTDPAVLTPIQARELMQHIDQICIKHGLQYLEKANGIDSRLKGIIKRLVIDPTVTIPQSTRHITLISVADSLLFNHLGRRKKTAEQLKSFFMQINLSLCDPEPLTEKEIDSIWSSALDFVNKNKTESRSGQREQKMEGVEAEPGIIEEASETILNIYRFLTIEESKDILFYHNGVYAPGGEVLIEKECEHLFGYSLSNKHLAEIKGHVMRSTYHKHAEIDADINIINMKNGLYDIITGEFKEHTPEYLSVNQKPIKYDPKSKPKLFREYLQQVLYPTEIRTAVELIAYTFCRDNKYEIITILFGYGANGKSVFTGLLTALHGAKNVSNVPLSLMIKNTFALSDLENRDVNIDTELSSATIEDSTILKKLTGKQPVRIERKHQRAYDTILHAKLFFSANRIPQTTDDSDAYYRRNIVISFPNRFEGDTADPDLLAKLTTDEEISGIFNVLMDALRDILLKNNGIFINEKTIRERRRKYEMAANPIGSFIEHVVARDSIESDKTPKDEFYQAYQGYCRQNKLVVESKENFGKILKKKYHYQDGREASGERRTIWKGVRLVVEKGGREYNDNNPDDDLSPSRTPKQSMAA